LETANAGVPIDLAKSVAAYVTPDLAEANAVKSLLEANGIQAVLSEDKNGSLSLYSDDMIRSITLLVSGEHAKRAADIVQIFQIDQLTAKGETEGDGIECGTCHSVGRAIAKFCDQCGRALTR
jgi:type III secretory pathway lipoprotein EscJ